MPTSAPTARPAPAARWELDKAGRRRGSSGSTEAAGKEDRIVSVLVFVRINGDTEKFQALMKDHPERFAEIAPEAQAAGAIHHRFGVGDGYVVAVDEWESADAFLAFFQGNEKIPQIMQDAGAAPGEPEIVIAEAISSPDEF
jgi:hypothetical protein